MRIQCTRSVCERMVTRADWQIARARYTFCSSECRWIYYRDQAIAQAWEAVLRNGPLPESHPEFGSCWIWPGKPRPNGYGSATAPDGTKGLAHHIALEMQAGPIPPGFFACHTCDVRNCVRNDTEGVYEINGVARLRWGHLFVGTRADNMADMSLKKRKGSSWSEQTIPNLARGSHHGGAKLTEDQVREIRRRYAAGGIKYADLGAEYGVHAGTIGGIISRKEWVHVD